MKTENKILITFLLNFVFSIFEFIGGILTGSIAIISDAMHDLGDAFSIGVSFLLEKKSKRKPDEKYTYGYARFSVLSSVIITSVLILGSILVVYNSVKKIINPSVIDFNIMIVLSIVGVVVNLFATILTHKGNSLNQKAVNLHMIEDVLGWIVVLIGAIVMKLTGLTIIDPIMSIIIALFILIMAIKNLKQSFEVLLDKVPSTISVETVKNEISLIDGIIDIHHIHLWTIDGQNNYLTMHIVTNRNNHEIKESVKEKLKELNINHTTLEIESETEICHDKHCHILQNKESHQHHHCHHH